VTLVVVTGTGTDVGKTFVSAAVLRALRARGVRVRAYKPVQSFAPNDASTDADVLAAATQQEPHDVCPAHRWLSTPMAPPMAADALGLSPFTIADLARETPRPEYDELLLVEGAGGPRSPVAADGDTVDLVNVLKPARVVLVADAGLGTINVVRMSVDALRAHPIAVYINRFDPANDLHQRNVAWLRTREGLDVVTDVEALARLIAASR
jgi:dethiobiotin synthetase